MTLKKFNQLYDWYKTYHDMDMKKMTFQDIDKAQAEDDEWL